MKIRWMVIVSLLCVSSCGGGGDSSNVDPRVGDVVGDTSAMQEATAAANPILRKAADCAFVQENIGDVNATLDEIESRVQTAAGRTSLQSLRKQVANVADTCGAR